MIKIGMAAKDERGRYSGGKAGDQTRKEVYVRTWYSRPWDRVIRINDASVREKFARSVEDICRNDNIGYSQSSRLSLWAAASEQGWKVSEIRKPCNCDCSSLIAVAARSAGLTIPRDVWTGNLESAFLRVGGVTVLTEPRFLTSDAYVLRGDILLNTLHHVAVALEDGPQAENVPEVAKINTSGYPEISRGSRGVYVVLLQQALTVRGYPLEQDGEFGPDTERKVRSFQSDFSLTVDGIVGPKTWYALFNR